MGFVVAGAGIVLTLGLQRMGIGAAWAYVLPGAVVWIGMLQTGAHPTLAGVVLGLITPVRSRPMREPAMDTVTRAANDMAAQTETAEPAAKDLSKSLRELRLAQRELIPPVVRVQMALHPWVAFGVMPLFALANAGVGLDGIDVADGASRSIMLGVLVALVLGKPLGVISASWLAVRVGLCRLPPGVSWSGVSLVGLLAGIGFTMSIFIANLAFTQDPLLGAAKLGVLAGSLASAVLGLTWGVAYAWRLRSFGTRQSSPA
jgi:NhaA family Na+:H+ antiporter